MKNRIAARMRELKSQGGKSLSVVLMIGDPDIEKTFRDIQTAVDLGIDIIELGIPIANPVLDSQVMYDSMNRALAFSKDWQTYLDALKQIRQLFPSTPFEVMVYYDTVMEAGFDHFCNGLIAAEMDAVLVADGVFQGADLLQRLDAALKPAGCIPIRFVPHPYHPEQFSDLKENGSGFIVVQTKTDARGRRDRVLEENKETLDVLRQFGIETPLVMAYGIKTPEDIRQCIELGADGVLIGTIVLDAAYRLPEDQFIHLLSSFRQAAR